jgi:hypothetical protein
VSGGGLRPTTSHPNYPFWDKFLALRQQLAVCRQSVKHPKLHPRDRVFWVSLSGPWPNWRKTLAIVQRETVIKWH